MAFTVFYDEPQEAVWFKNLAPEIEGAEAIPISDAKSSPQLAGVLGYDRPDIILLDDDRPVLVVEETVEVPSGHNVGQRFARLAAAAEHQVPCLYFGPYVAKKHGGDTAGPRYMNLRLFGALDAMVRVTGTAVTTINWPVDSNCEVRRDSDKDRDVREYIETLLRLNRDVNPKDLNQAILKSTIQARMLKERVEFVSQIRRQEQYDLPPDSVQVLTSDTFRKAYKFESASIGLNASEIVLYQVGMRKIRSDPYTGMAMLYRYLYIAEHKDRALILWFPHIDSATWKTTAQKAVDRKDIRLFRHSAEAILFSDKLIPKADL